MIDVTTQEPLSVSTAGEAGSFLLLPVQQLDEICALLDAHNVSYWVDEEAISVDGDPETTVINFSYRTDPSMIQKLLDDAP
jgi:hypothetical protein